MSDRFARVPIQAAADRRLNETALRVLIALATHADDAGECRPGTARLAAMTDMDRRQVSKGVRTLEATGYLVRDRRYREGGAYSSNSYQLVYHPQLDASQETQAHASPEAHVSGVACVPTDASHASQETQAHASPEAHATEQPIMNSPDEQPSAEAVRRARAHGPDAVLLEGEILPPEEPITSAIERPKSTIAPVLELELAGEVHDPGRRALELWNDMAKRTGLPIVQDFSDQRRKAAMRRLKDLGGLAGWEACLEKIEASDFLAGRTQPSPGRDKAFKATIDWVLEPKNLTRIMEGNYDPSSGRDRPSTRTSASGATGVRPNPMLEAVRAMRQRRLEGG